MLTMIWPLLAFVVSTTLLQDETPPETPQTVPANEAEASTQDVELDAFDPTFEPVTELVKQVNSEPVSDTVSENVHYRLKVKLDPKAKTIDGSLVLTYTNNSPDEISELQFHLYMNAFKHENTTFAIERGNLVDAGTADEHSYGYVDINELEFNGRHALDRLQYIQPDDGNVHDQTVASISLDEPLQPGSSMDIKCRFITKLPKAIDRTGFHKNTFFAAQWFPKLGVWETAGFHGREEAGWNCHQFHAVSEFYADFGLYDVSITVPADFEVGASGRLVKVDDSATHKTFSFSGERIHDFTWLASSEMVRIPMKFVPKEWVSDAELEAVMSLHGISLDEASLKPVDVILFMAPEHEEQSERHFKAVAQAIKYFGLWYGAYPYTSITCVDPPYGLSEIGGMEYPNLITMGTDWIKPKDERDPDGVTIHEFGHQYWYGMTGSNEFEASWLDEGFNTYSTGLVMAIVHNPIKKYVRFNHLPFEKNALMYMEPYTDFQRSRAQLIRDQGTDSVLRNAWEYKNTESYFNNSYGKAATMLHQLSRELGADAFARAMRIYASQYRYNHPNSHDFQATIEQLSGRDFGWFFEQFIFGHQTIDYAVGEVKSHRYDEAIGFLETENGRVFVTEPDLANPSYLHQITIENGGTGRYPVDIAVRFADGTEQRLQWDGSYRWKKFSLNHASEITEVEIDPDHRIIIDFNSFNNSYRAQADSQVSQKWSLRFLLRIQQILQTLSGVMS